MHQQLNSNFLIGSVFYKATHSVDSDDDDDDKLLWTIHYTLKVASFNMCENLIPIMHTHAKHVVHWREFALNLHLHSNCYAIIIMISDCASECTSFKMEIMLFQNHHRYQPLCLLVSFALLPLHSPPQTSHTIKNARLQIRHVRFPKWI